MNYILAFFLPALMGWLNRVRGGGLGGEKLPGHPRFYVAVAVTLILLPFMKWWAFLAGVFWLSWAIMPHGHFYQFGRNMPEREWTVIEEVCWNLGGRTDFGAMYVRNATIIPFGLLLGYHSSSYFLPIFAALAPLAMTSSRAWLMVVNKNAADGVQDSEIVDGAIMGFLMAWMISVT